MSVSNTAIQVTDLDFASIKNNLKTFLRSQEVFQDYDFEGSGMSVLLNVLALNTHYMAYFLNMAANEAFLDTAQLRGSVLSLAKHMNYVPSSAKGAQVKADIIVTPTVNENQALSTLTLDQYTRFLAQDIDGVNYQFVSLYSNTAAKSGASFTFPSVTLKQGEVSTIQFLMEPSNTSRRFTIPSANIDTDTLIVSVQESASNTDTTIYTLNQDITELKSNTTVYFLEENPDETYTIYFGDDVLGKKPKNGSIIIATYLDTVGSPANNIIRFYQSEPIGGLFTDNVKITATGPSYGGTEKETIDQIKTRAPYAYTTQNRAVTVLDYETLLRKDYNIIDSVSVWGGEDADPVVYGKVFISIKTKGNYALTNLEKENIKQALIKSRSVLTITPEIVDPDYIYLLIKGSVYYNPQLTTLPANDIVTYAKAAISDYTERDLNNFKSTFRKAKLQNFIENSERSITGSDISVYAQKRQTLSLGQRKNYTFNFNMPLEKNSYTNKMYTSPEVQVFDDSGISRNVYFEETPFSATGIDAITILSSDGNYISKPTVTISGDGAGAVAEAVIQSGKLKRIDILNAGSNYTWAKVVISPDESGVAATAVPRLESRKGTIRSFYYKDNGEKVVLNNNAGTIVYDTGVVVLTNLLTSTGTVDRYYGQSVLTVNFPIAKELITPLRNRILVIDENDSSAIDITPISET